MDKSWLKMPKMVNFGKFLNIWSLRSKSVTRQVNSDWTKSSQHYERSELHLQSEWTKVNQKYRKWSFLASFWNPEACGQTVLPDRSILIRQKLAGKAKIQKFKCDILSNFQTLWTILKVLLDSPFLILGWSDFAKIKFLELLNWFWVK